MSRLSRSVITSHDPLWQGIYDCAHEFSKIFPNWLPVLLKSVMPATFEIPNRQNGNATSCRKKKVRSAKTRKDGHYKVLRRTYLWYCHFLQRGGMFYSKTLYPTSQVVCSTADTVQWSP